MATGQQEDACWPRHDAP